jgi:DNA-binding protein YbaB
MLVAFVAAALSACAERIGKNAAAGAMAELQKERASSATDTNKQVVRIAGERAVEGVVEALDAPEQREAIKRLIADAVSAAAASAVEETTRRMIAELGPGGEGPLADTLVRTGERVSAAAAVAAMGGMGSELAGLLPECSGPDRMECIDRRLQQTARSTAASFTSGVKDSLGWQLLLLMFMLGAGGGVLGAWLWSLRPVRRREFRTA